MIGKLGRLIFSKKHPVATLAKRYQLNISAVAHASAAAMTEEDDGDDAHPLLGAGALNSFTKSTTVRWPMVTRWNSSRHPWTDRQEHARTRILIPILGKDECRAYAHLSPAFELVNVHSRVQVGIYNYNSKRNEDRKLTEKTRESFFKILAKDVPIMVLDFGGKPDWRPNAILYGRILNFAELRVEAWRPGKPYLLAEVHLYREQLESPLVHPRSTTRLPFFNLMEPVMFFEKNVTSFDRNGVELVSAPPIYQRTAHCYVPVHQIAGMIAIAPKTPTKGPTKNLNYYVLPLD